MSQTYPDIMNEAHVDLSARGAGHFAPEDWEEIRFEALRRLRAKGWSEALSRSEAHRLWQEVVRDFHAESAWGYTPRTAPMKLKLPSVNMGVKFIWMAGLTMIVTIAAVVWLGQIYTASGDSKDGMILYAVIGAALINFGLFLWWNGGHSDEEREQKAKQELLNSPKK